MTDAKECCGECKFFELVDSEPTEGWCRRFPPTITYPQEDGGDTYGWPITVPPDWCGEFQPRAEEKEKHLSDSDMKAVYRESQQIRVQMDAYIREVSPKLRRMADELDMLQKGIFMVGRDTNEQIAEKVARYMYPTINDISWTDRYQKEMKKIVLAALGAKE